MKLEQSHLRAFLDAELEHTMGAYRVASESLGRLAQRPKGPECPKAFTRAVDAMREYNGLLNTERHSWLASQEHRTRHPLPKKFVYAHDTTFAGAALDPDQPDRVRRPNDAWTAVYYETALAALEPEHPGGQDLELFREWLVRPRDGGPDEQVSSPEEDENRSATRAARFRERRQRLPPALADEDAGPNLRAIVEANLGVCDIPAFVIATFTDAHLFMHGVEYLLAGGLRHHIEARGRDTCAEWLELAIASLTFTYSIARTSPWSFASNDDEADKIFADHPQERWNRMVPTVTMWLSAQVALLSLHRRAYAWSLSGDDRRAFNDYYKLRRHIRETNRRLRAAHLQVQRSREFLSALDAIADYHMGELYRERHAHTTALRHFRRAEARLRGSSVHADKPARQPERDSETLENSRWRVELLISIGKSSYELGQFKEALAWYLRAWRAFLELLARDTATDVNIETIDAVVDWLESVAHEPVIYKDDLAAHMRPVADQLAGVEITERLGTLVAEILSRIGHLLFVLQPEQANDPPAARVHRLALLFLIKASRSDQASTVLATDLLKLAYRVGEQRDDGDSAEQTRLVLAEIEERLDQFTSLGDQWQGTGGDFERLARSTEYVLLKELVGIAKSERTASIEVDAQESAPRRLLVGMFMHTDSIHSRRSQVHEQLTRLPQRRDAELGPKPRIEFVCMRRFSSAFPLLPRPAAFRSLAGGYFVRITANGAPFGIAVDPGSDFIENLFRSQHAIADIDMVVVTHDHVDHINSFEPLLALLHERRRLARLEGQPPLPILVNASVLRRLRSARVYADLDFYGFTDAGVEWDPDDWLPSGSDKQRPPKSLDALNTHLTKRLGTETSITAVSSLRHLDICGNPSMGFILKVGPDGPSLGFTSDAPRPNDDPDWTEHARPLLDADVLVAHVSSLPLAELRAASGLGRGVDPTTPDDRDDLLRLFDWVDEHANEPRVGPVAARLRYAYWLGERGEDADLVGPGGLSTWRQPSEHLYLGGLTAYAVAHAARRPAGVFVVGELSEELGSLRGRIATTLNREIAADKPRWKAVTADIALAVSIGRKGGMADTRVRCTTCDLDNDRELVERYHGPADIFEVCVKGENEGIFYNCRWHDPSHRKDKTFLERMERYDLFGR